MNSKRSLQGHQSGNLKIWMALASAVVPILMGALSTYNQNVPYFELGALTVRSMPFIELYIFLISLYVFIRCFRRRNLFEYTVWSVTFLVAVMLGLGCAKFLALQSDLDSCFAVAGVVLVDFTSASSFGFAYRVGRMVVRQRRKGRST